MGLRGRSGQIYWVWKGNVAILGELIPGLFSNHGVLLRIRPLLMEIINFRPGNRKHSKAQMDFNLNYNVSVGLDPKKFQRQHFEKLAAMLRKKCKGIWLNERLRTFAMA